MKTFWVYILECSDGKYYTGITNNIERRVYEHNSGILKGYTSLRLPVKLVYSSSFSDPLTAIEREKQIKKWSHQKKKALIENNFEKLVELSRKK
ncbi:MAG: GIY-YIG nuclease family protein [Melioribacteraceae bacterium]|nr:GIY-YIG nuclease family protein [Melioribacteraceae bacterium]